MSTNGRFYLGLSLSILLATSLPPAYAQSPVGAFYAQREAILQEQAKQAAQSSGDQKADAGSSGSSGSASGSSSGSSSTETKTDDSKAADTKKEDTSTGDGDKKADSDKDDDKKKSDDDDDKKKADDDDDKKKSNEDKKMAKSDKSDKSDKKTPADAYSPVKAAIFDMNSGNAAAAISTLKTVLDKNPKDVQAHYVLGAAYVMARKYQDAIAQYNTVLKLVPATSKLGQLASQGLRNISK